MQLEMNGEAVHTQAPTLEALLKERSVDAGTVAVAADGRFVSRAQYAQLRLAEGMRLEVLTAMQGG